MTFKFITQVRRNNIAGNFMYVYVKYVLVI